MSDFLRLGTRSSLLAINIRAGIVAGTRSSRMNRTLLVVALAVGSALEQIMKQHGRSLCFGRRPV